MTFLPSQYTGPSLTDGTGLDLPEGWGELYRVSIQWWSHDLPDHSKPCWVIKIGHAPCVRKGGKWDRDMLFTHSSKDMLSKLGALFTFDEACATVLNHFPTWQAKVVKDYTPRKKAQAS